MNTYTNVIHPKKEAHRTASNSLLHNTAIVTILLVLVTTGITIAVAPRGDGRARDPQCPPPRPA